MGRDDEDGMGWDVVDEFERGKGPHRIRLIRGVEKHVDFLMDILVEKIQIHDSGHCAR